MKSMGYVMSIIRRSPRIRREDPRWKGIQRGYDAAEVIRLRGSLVPEQTLARRGAERLWEMLSSGECVRALGALTGAQAVQMVQAGLKSIYVSGWQVAGDMNTAGQTYPDQSLYPADSAPRLVARINAARPDLVWVALGSPKQDLWMAEHRERLPDPVGPRHLCPRRFEECPKLSGSYSFRNSSVRYHEEAVTPGSRTATLWNTRQRAAPWPPRISGALSSSCGGPPATSVG